MRPCVNGRFPERFPDDLGFLSRGMRFGPHGDAESGNLLQLAACSRA